MAGKAKKPANNGSSEKAPRPAVRPVFIAGGLGLAWFAAAPQSLPVDGAPSWSVAALTIAQLFTDFIGGWIVVALVQLGIAVVRYALARTRARPPQPMEAG